MNLEIPKANQSLRHGVCEIFWGFGQDLTFSSQDLSLISVLIVKLSYEQILRYDALSARNDSNMVVGDPSVLYRDNPCKLLKFDQDLKISLLN